MRGILDFIQKDINSRKKISVIITIALFVVALIPSILLASYSFYVKSNTGLVIGGTVSTSGDADIILNVYMQDRDSNGIPVSESYSKVYFIPIHEYSYNSARSSCTNGVSIDSFDSETGNFVLNAGQKGYCDVYFDALESDIIKSNPNGIIRIFAEQTFDEGDYKEVGQVPGDNYIINEAKTAQTCPNVTLEGRNISITSSGYINFLIYLDLVQDMIAN